MMLEGKVAIVTGAAMGIGAGTAELFAREGAAVYLLDLDGAAAEARARVLREAGLDAEAMTCDVSRGEAVEYAVKAIGDRRQAIDILVNNAGIYPRRAFLEITEQEWDQMLDVNLKSMYHTSRHVLPYMIARRRGWIVNISSITFSIGVARLTHYVASKGGVLGFTRSLAREMGEYNIYVNSITPGAVKTEGETVHTTEAEINAVVAGQCLKRRLLPIDVARVCLFLASELCSGLTGQNVNVDGGLVMY